jgi:hypothetical protein
VIEEQQEAEKTGGLDSIKVLLKDPARKQLDAIPSAKQISEIQARSDDVHVRKRNILSDEQQRKKRELLHREEVMTKQVERLANLQQKVKELSEQKVAEKPLISLPVIHKPRHYVH